MDVSNVLGLVVLIVVVFLAFRVGAFLMKGLLGLLAIAVVVWLILRLVGGGGDVLDPAAAGALAGALTPLRGNGGTAAGDIEPVAWRAGNAA